MNLEEKFVKCSYCYTVYHFKQPADESGPNYPMCGTPTGTTATKDDIKRAKWAECLRDGDGDHISDEVLRALNIDFESLGKSP